MATTVPPPATNPGVTGLWRGVDFVYGQSGRPVAAMHFTAANGNQSRLMTCRWDDSATPEVTDLQTFETEAVRSVGLVRRPSGVLDVFYDTTDTLWRRTSRDDGATWSAAAAQTIPGNPHIGSIPTLALAVAGGYFVLATLMTAMAPAGLIVGALDSADVITWSTPVTGFPVAGRFQPLADGSVLILSSSTNAGKRITKFDGVGAFTLAGTTGLSGSNQPGFVDAYSLGMTFTKINSPDPLILGRWNPTVSLRNSAGTGWTFGGDQFPGIPTYRSAGGLVGDGACVRKNRAGVWELLYANLSNELGFIRCRNQNGTGAGVWS